MEGPVVATTAGLLRGTGEGDLAVFRGVPYAQPPIGARRWAAPSPVTPWDGIRDATTFGPSCPQPFRPGGNPLIGEHGSPPFDEDCLYLNAWTPSTTEQGRPVVVWIHGGGFLTGSSAVPAYAGDNLARRAGAVVFSLNYRLGAFGFLAGVGDTENLWLADQVAALRWIADNARAFGGDPDRIVLMGQSGGGFSIGALLQHPSARGLVSSAIVQSAPLGLDLPDIATATERTRALATVLGLSDVRALADEPAEHLVRGTLEVLKHGTGFGRWPLAFLPVLDPDTMPRHPREALADADVPLLTGWTADEASYAFGMDPTYHGVTEARVVAWMSEWSDAPRDLYASYMAGGARSARDVVIAACSDRLFRGPSTTVVEERAARGHRTYAYEFALRSPAYDSALGSPHCFELPFTFGNTRRWPTPSFLDGLSQSARDAATAVMQDAWATFIVDGSPASGGRQWPPYTSDRPACSVLGTTVETRCGLPTPWRI